MKLIQSVNDNKTTAPSYDRIAKIADLKDNSSQAVSKLSVLRLQSGMTDKGSVNSQEKKKLVNLQALIYREIVIDQIMSNFLCGESFTSLSINLWELAC